jgi:hypothetical protein
MNDKSNNKRPILVGPPWACPECHARATRLVNYFSALSKTVSGTLLEQHGEFVYYLYGLPDECKKRGHTARMVKVGNAITPVRITLTEENYDQEALYDEIEEAIKFLVKETGYSLDDDVLALLYRVACHDVNVIEAHQKILDILSGDMVIGKEDEHER